MGNCLVTRLKSSVDNENLEYFDALQIKIDWSKYADSIFPLVTVLSGTRQPIFGGVGCKCKILSNGLIGTTASHTETEYTFIENEANNIAVYPADNSSPTEFLIVGLNKITMLGVGLAEGVYMKNPLRQKYCNNLGTYTNILMNFKGYLDGPDIDVSDFFSSFAHKINVTIFRESAKVGTGWKTYLSTESIKDYVNLTTINYYLSLKGNISHLANLTKLTNLNLRNAAINGDIASLGKLTVLTMCNFNDSSISGSIEDFVTAQYNATDSPRKSASGATRIQMYFNDSTNITLNGTKMSIGGGKYLAWDDGGSAPTNIRFENS